MSIEAFIAALRAAIAEHREKTLAIIATGKLDERDYSRWCGYLIGLDDVTRPRGKDPTDVHGFIEQVLSDLRKE